MDDASTFRVNLDGNGPKSGTLLSPDGPPPIPIGRSVQSEETPAGWSPTQLFVGAVASCLMTTFHAIARMSGLTVLGYSDAATGVVVRGEDRLYKVTEITLRPRVIIEKANKVELALRLLKKAERVCQVSRSIKSTVRLDPEVLVSGPVGQNEG
jgi:organic hydroperoxide reductase OsmC/OhrA